MTTTFDFSPAARVRRGARLLDEWRPGWEGEIDLTRLRMAATCWCVLGQLEGDYFYGIDAMFAGILEGDPENDSEQRDVLGEFFGFYTPYGDPRPHPKFFELELHWRTEIHARRQVKIRDLLGVYIDEAACELVGAPA